MPHKPLCRISARDGSGIDELFERIDKAVIKLGRR
jgi:hypothetical protein